MLKKERNLQKALKTKQLSDGDISGGNTARKYYKGIKQIL